MRKTLSDHRDAAIGVVLVAVIAVMIVVGLVQSRRIDDLRDRVRALEAESFQRNRKTLEGR